MDGSTYKCDQCSFTTHRSFNFSRHKLKHGGDLKKVVTSFNCCLCGQNKTSKDAIVQHYTSDHGIEIETQYHQFENISAFWLWLGDLETRTTSKFKKVTGTKRSKNDDRKFDYYRCHRNGVFKSCGTGKRQIKSQSSNKINGFCPAAITASYFDPKGVVEVAYIPTHVGHQNDLGHINLTMDQKSILAGKIESNVPFDQILGEFKGNSCDVNVQRIHLLKKKDLNNIKTRFNLSGRAVKETNYVNVDSWAKDNMNTGLVRFYKPQGAFSSTYPALSTDDFVLVVANDAQLDLLKKYGQDCVCFDVSRSIGNCDFELASILVLDELNQAFPCALMFSKKSNANSLSAFISVLQNILGSLSTKVLTTDMSDDYRNTWNAVMGAATHHLYGDWYVVQAWKENLRKVRGDKKRKEILSVLQNLLQEKDRFVFSHMLSTTLTQLDADQETSEFGRYFKSEFLGCLKSWAYCYRDILGFGNSMKIENLHQVLKYMNINCKRAKKLDVAVHSIMHFIRDKLFKRVVSLQESMRSTNSAIMKSLHERAVEMTGVLIERKGTAGWVFSPSPTSPRKYEIVRNDFECVCKSKCEQCGACAHQFRCTCHDSAIRWNVCKHIHFIATNCQQEYIAAAESALLAAPAVVDDNTSGDLFFDVFDPENPEIPQQVTVTVVSHDEQDTSKELEEGKKRLITSLQEVIESGVNTLEHVRICEKAISSIRPAIAACSTFLPNVELEAEGSPQWFKNFMSPKN